MKAKITLKCEDGKGNITRRILNMTLVSEYSYHKVFRHEGGYLESFTNAEITQMRMRGEFEWC